MKFKFSILFLMLSSLAFADFQPFDGEVKCVSKNDWSSVTLRYDKKEYPNFGWQGGIHLEIQSGVNSSLSSMIVNAKLAEEGNRQTLQRKGPAGQVGNWIQQDSKDRILSQVRLGFTTYDLLGKDGSVAAQAHSFISSLHISKASTTGFSASSKIETHEFYLVELLDDYNHSYLKFELDECTAK